MSHPALDSGHDGTTLTLLVIIGQYSFSLVRIFHGKKKIYRVIMKVKIEKNQKTKNNLKIY